MLTEEGTEYPLQENVVNNLQAEMRAWREMYYSLLGLTRNTIRTTATAKVRMEQISEIVEESVKESRKLASNIKGEV